MQNLSIKWHNPNWGEPDFRCPHCSEGWDDDEKIDSEYGYFMPEAGQEIYLVKCEATIGLTKNVGSGRSFNIKRAVNTATMVTVTAYIQCNDMKRLVQQYIDSVGGEAHQSAVEIIDQLERAYLLARNSAAGLTNYCEESVGTRRCERELEEAEQVYREI